MLNNIEDTCLIQPCAQSVVVVVVAATKPYFMSFAIAIALNYCGTASIPISRLIFFLIQSWKRWLEVNQKKKSSMQQINWTLTFGVVLDCIWFARNDFIFANNSVSFRSIFLKAQGRIEASLQAVNVTQKLDPLVHNRNETSVEFWVPPPFAFVKLNVDRSVRNGGSTTGCGGVARDHDGEFLFAFSLKLDGCLTIEAKVWALFHGQCLVWDKSYNKISSFQLIELLDGGTSTHTSLSPILEEG